MRGDNLTRLDLAVNLLMIPPEIYEVIIPLYRPIGPGELELLTHNEFTRWPPRLADQSIFYAVTNEEYARQIATRWNIPESGVGYVTRFNVRKSFMDHYQVHRVGGTIHTEWWIPAEDLDALNENIVGMIEVIGEYHR